MQLTIIGGILTNILLILGLAIICGSLRRHYQYFHPPVAHVSSNLLSLSATSVLIPTSSSLLSQATPENLIKQSRVASFLLIIVYGLYLVYQLATHKQEFKMRGQHVPSKPFRQSAVPPGGVRGALVLPATVFLRGQSEAEHTRLRDMIITRVDDDKDKEYNDPRLHFGVAVTAFLVSTVLLYFCIDYAVNSIDNVISQTGVTRSFIGLIVLPLPNCDFTAITWASKDKMDNALSATIGKCLQTALFVLPLVVLIAWGVGVDSVTLVFDGFEIVSLFAAILLLNFLMTKGEVSWYV